MIELDSVIDDKLKLKLNEIRENINSSLKLDGRFFSDDFRIDIKIEPMASGTMVINKAGYFDKIIKKIDRKVAAVEMESYGVARACKYGNNGDTIPIIFKSVMDHTSDKKDQLNGINIKKFAAYTSAQFLRCLFEFEII